LFLFRSKCEKVEVFYLYIMKPLLNKKLFFCCQMIFLSGEGEDIFEVWSQEMMIERMLLCLVRGSQAAPSNPTLKGYSRRRGHKNYVRQINAQNVRHRKGSKLNLLSKDSGFTLSYKCGPKFDKERHQKVISVWILQKLKFKQ